VVPIEVLRDFALFDGLDDEELTRITQLCNERTFEQDAVCFAQGGNASDLRLCRTGKVSLVVKLYEPWSREVVIYRVKPGEVFGWSALVHVHVLGEMRREN
jgi:CRP-like cAMP-binding protein